MEKNEQKTEYDQDLLIQENKPHIMEPIIMGFPIIWGGEKVRENILRVIPKYLLGLL